MHVLESLLNEKLVSPVCFLFCFLKLSAGEAVLYVGSKIRRVKYEVYFLRLLPGATYVTLLLFSLHSVYWRCLMLRYITLRWDDKEKKLDVLKVQQTSELVTSLKVFGPISNGHVTFLRQLSEF